jgi:recombination protein RecA
MQVWAESFLTCTAPRASSFAVVNSVVEIYGPESSGKTTLALHAIAESQRAGGTAAFIDAEHALDPVYAANLGVDVDQLLVSQPDSGEMALDVVDQLVRSSAVDVIVVDSVAALVPRVELEGDMSDAQIGLQARLMSKAMRKITGSLALSQCTVIFLNQLRSKVGVIYGSPEVTSGGNALKFYASVRYVWPTVPNEAGCCKRGEQLLISCSSCSSSSVPQHRR